LTHIKKQFDYQPTIFVELTHYVATLTDITQKKATAEEIERLAFRH
jgi:hypothetical protein